MDVTRYQCPFNLPYAESEKTAAETLHGHAAVFADRTMDTPIQRLTDARYLAEQLDKAMAEVVAEARAQGATWTDVGNALRVSKQAAQQRFGGA